MKFKIGFSADDKKDIKVDAVHPKENAVVTPRPSLVDISFPNIYKSYTYYNNRFDLREGDTVFVDGKLEGVAGRVVAVNYNFKIKLSEYKRVIGVADTDVKGQLCFAGTRVISFDPHTISFNKIASWYFPPADPEEEIVCGEDDSTIVLDRPETWKADIDPYDSESDDDFAVVYLSLDNGTGRAIVKGNHYHPIEFFYENGEISKLICNCYSAGMCRHKISTLFELRRKLKWIEENYADEFQKSAYFAVLDKAAFCNMVLMSRKNGSFQIG